MKLFVENKFYTSLLDDSFPHKDLFRTKKARKLIVKGATFKA